MDDFMSDEEQDCHGDGGKLSIQLNDEDSASEQHSPNPLPTAKKILMTFAEDGFKKQSSDSEQDSGNGPMISESVESDAKGVLQNSKSILNNGQSKTGKTDGSRHRQREARKRSGKRKFKEEEPEDGEILEDGEIASDGENDFRHRRQRRDVDDFSEKSASSAEECEMRSDASENEGEATGNEKSESLSRRERRKRKRERREKRRKKNEAKKKRRRLEYVDHDKVDDEFNWNLSSKGRTLPGPYDSPSDKQSSSPYRSPGPYDSPYESPPGLYDSPSEDEEDNYPPRLLSMAGDGFIDLAGADKDEILKLRERKKSRSSRKKSHHHHHSKKKPLLDIPRQHGVCKFFMEGKCSKADECPFSHDFIPQKKSEICKFYLNSICTKGDGCLFMHGEYPCKYFHTGAQCYQGENCKFSHEPLNEETKILLQKALDSRDDERSDDSDDSLTHESVEHMREKGGNQAPGSNGGSKKIPSLFDIKVYPPGQSPKKPQGSTVQPPGRPGFYKDALSLSPSGNSSCSLPPSGAGIGGLGSVSIRPPIGSPGHSSFIGARQTAGDCPSQQQQTPPQLGCSPPHPQQSVMIGSNYPDDKNVPQPLDNLHHSLHHPFHHRHGALEDRHNTDEEKEERKQIPIEIPSHLPPKQKELFMRIHQQQQLAGAIMENTDARDNMDDIDDWYSSDEDGDGEAGPKLAEILKNLNKQPPEPPVQTQSDVSNNSALNIMQMINAIRGQPATSVGAGPSSQTTVSTAGGTIVTTSNNSSSSSSSSSNNNSSSSSGCTSTSASSSATSTVSVTGGSAASATSNTSSARRDPRLQGTKATTSSSDSKTAPAAPMKTDPRLQSSKPTVTETTTPSSSSVIVQQDFVAVPSTPPGEIVYRLYEVSTYKIPLSATIDVFHSKFKNDPRIQKHLSNPPESLKQKILPGDPDKTLIKSFVVPNPNRPGMDTTVDELPMPSLPPVNLPPITSPVVAPSSSKRPQDPRRSRILPSNSRIVSKKVDDKDNTETNKSADPRMSRGGPDPFPPAKPLDPRLLRLQPNSAGPSRPIDPRRSKQDSSKSFPGRVSSDPRASKQQSPVEQSLPPMLAQMPNPVVPRPPNPVVPRPSNPVVPRPSNPVVPRPSNPVVPRPSNPVVPRPPVEPAVEKRGPRKQETPAPLQPLRPNNPRLMRQESQSKTEQSESSNAEGSQPKLDHRNDPRFRRKPAGESGSSLPPIRKVTGQRKVNMEYSSPLGTEADKPEQNSGYNSYNRPPNANRQMGGNNNKIRTGGPESGPPTLPPGKPHSSGGNDTTHGSVDPRDVANHPSTSDPPSNFPPQMQQSGSLQQYPPVLPPDQPKLKDLFKIIDPTASPFC